MQNNYSDGAQPHIKIGNDILERLRVRPHFLLEFSCSSDTAWYAELLLSTEILCHAAKGCEIEIKGKCLQGALFPELTEMAAGSCGHGEKIVLSASQRDKILNGVGNAILQVADIAPAIDRLLSGGTYQLNGSENQAELLRAASIDTLRQSVISPIRAMLDANGYGLPLELSLWDNISVHKPTSLDSLLKQTVRAHAVIQKASREPNKQSRHRRWRKIQLVDSETAPRSMQMNDLERPDIRQLMDEDGALEMATFAANALSGTISGSGPTFPVILVQENSAARLLNNGDLEGAIRMCMADIAATCARCWYQLCPAKDTSSRVASLINRFRTVLYNGKLITGNSDG